MSVMHNGHRDARVLGSAPEAVFVREHSKVGSEVPK